MGRPVPSLLLTLALLLAALPVAADDPAAADTAADDPAVAFDAAAGAPAAAFEAAYERFSAAYRQGDPDAVAALYTDDAYYLSPNADITRGDVRAHFAWLERFEPGEGPEISFDIVDRDVDGDLGYDVGRYTIRNAGNVSRGKFIVVWTRGEDGAWRIHADGFSAIRPPEDGAGE